MTTVYIAIEKQLVYREGDERQHPGQGIRAYSTSQDKVTKFNTEIELLDWLKTRPNIQDIEVFKAQALQVTVITGIRLA